MGNSCRWATPAGRQFLPMGKMCPWAKPAGGQNVPIGKMCRWARFTYPIWVLPIDRFTESFFSATSQRPASRGQENRPESIFPQGNSRGYSGFWASLSRVGDQDSDLFSVYFPIGVDIQHKAKLGFVSKLRTKPWATPRANK